MPISRTNTPTQSSVIVSLEKKKKKTAQRGQPALQSLFTPTPPHIASSSFSLHFKCLRPRAVSSRPVCFWKPDLYLLAKLVARTRLPSPPPPPSVVQQQETVRARVIIKYKVHTDLQQVMLLYVLITEAQATNHISNILKENEPLQKKK